MEVVCTCREVLLMLGGRAVELELNNQIWPRLQAQGVSWAKMREMLDRLTAAELVTLRKRPVECNRLGSFYRLSETGWQEFRTLTKPKGKKGHANATSFLGEKDCCCKKAA